MNGDKKDYVIDLEHQKCDCGLYAVEKIPYSHAIAAGTYAGLHISMPHLYARFTQRILFLSPQQTYNTKGYLILLLSMMLKLKIGTNHFYFPLFYYIFTQVKKYFKFYGTLMRFCTLKICVSFYIKSDGELHKKCPLLVL